MCFVTTVTNLLNLIKELGTVVRQTIIKFSEKWQQKSIKDARACTDIEFAGSSESNIYISFTHSAYTRTFYLTLIDFTGERQIMFSNYNDISL